MTKVLIRVKDVKFPKEELYDRYNKLVHMVCHKFNSARKYDYEELFSEGLLGLVKAYNTYDWDRDGTSFYTYSLNCITNQLRMYVRARRTIKYKMVNDYSLDYILNTDPDGTTFTIMDTISSDSDYTGPLVEEFLNMLSDRDKYVMIQVMKGTTHREIAKTLGYTPSRISRIVKNLGENYIRNTSMILCLKR